MDNFWNGFFKRASEDPVAELFDVEIDPPKEEEEVDPIDASRGPRPSFDRGMDIAVSLTRGY